MTTNLSFQTKASPCFLKPKPIASPRLRLFCFPYAGGSASIFRQWPPRLPFDIELLAAQYPGRATRLREAPCKDLRQILDDIEQAIAPLLDRPYAFFGHSMGATVAFELTRRLVGAKKPLPKHLFLSGRSAPQLPPTRAPLHDLPEEEFIDVMRELNGTPAELFEHREVLQMMLPVIRADFQALETWQYQGSCPFDIPVSVFGGIADDGVPLKHLDAWASCTTGRFKRHMFPGDHFFLHQQADAILNIIGRTLAIA
jgi:medium-chain acyl-[acyl-carrier-protein] hydrolase